MISNRRYMLVVAGTILAASVLVGIGIGIETGDVWHGARATGWGIGGAVVVMGLLWLGGRGSGRG